MSRRNIDHNRTLIPDLVDLSVILSAWIISARIGLCRLQRLQACTYSVISKYSDSRVSQLGRV